MYGDLLQVPVGIAWVWVHAASQPHLWPQPGVSEGHS